MIHDIIYYGSLGLACIFATLFCVRQYVVLRREAREDSERRTRRMEQRYGVLRPLSNSRRSR